MPDIPVGAQIFDICFHPSQPIVYTGLLTGEVKAFGYDEQGQHDPRLSLRPSKKSCRCLTVNGDGENLWAAGKGKSIYTIDTSTGTLIESRKAAHETAINRIKYLTQWLFATGDDDGVIKLWDPRKPEPVRSYAHHFDFISDFLWIEDKKQLVATSGDGTLSVVDVRSKKAEPLAQSEDQEDELLSIVSIKGGSKTIIGTQIGILSVFNRSAGWGDCVDRIPGHPQSIDALCALPTRYSPSGSAILTGSSDGLLRAVEILPTKMIGIVADHGSFPIERIAVDLKGEGRWVGSAGHEEVLKLTDLADVFEEEKEGEIEKDEKAADDSGAGSDQEANSDSDSEAEGDGGGGQKKGESERESSSESEAREKKRKRKNPNDLMKRKKKKGRNEVEAEHAFFAEL